MWRPRFRGTPRPAPAAGRRCFRAAQTPPAAPTPPVPVKKPVDVRVGIYIIQLGDPDLKTSEYKAVFWLWFR